MKTLQKLMLVLLLVACVAYVMPHNVVMAAGGATSVLDNVEADQGAAAGATTKLTQIVNKLLGFLQVASGLIAVLMIAITGFNYIVSTPEVKNEMKTKMLPIIIGVVLVFGAVSVARFIIGTFSLA